MQRVTELDYFQIQLSCQSPSSDGKNAPDVPLCNSQRMRLAECRKRT